MAARPETSPSDHEGQWPAAHDPSVGEDTPLLQSSVLSPPTNSNGCAYVEDEDWTPPKGLRWIQAGERPFLGLTWANVFLTGFDTTVAASTYAVIGSDFASSNNAAWISTSYLITATACQPLYGRFSDILGRRFCFLVATGIFSVGTLFCGMAPSMLTLNLARALAGVGGGGLMTMATVILSDNVPFKRRGIYQAANNLMYGVGGACGASLGGVIADSLGWRYAFFLQIPICTAAMLAGALLIVSPDHSTHLGQVRHIDVLGSLTLVCGLTTLLAAANMGGNEVPWSSPVIAVLFLSSAVLLAAFLMVEKHAAAPIMPLRMLKAVSTILTNFFSGMSVYTFLFMVPLYFQAVRSESASLAGSRLIVPALGFPLGAIIAGYVMSYYGQLNRLVQLGCAILFVGSCLPIGFSTAGDDPGWKYFWYLVPTNIGQGFVNPSSLFTMLAAFDHTDQAVATSTVYLFRAIGHVGGVSISSAVLQNVLTFQLPKALAGLPEADEVIDRIRHSVEAIDSVPLSYQHLVKEVYANGLRATFVVSAIFALVALISSFWAEGGSLRRSKDHVVEAN